MKRRLLLTNHRTKSFAENSLKYSSCEPLMLRQRLGNLARINARFTRGGLRYFSADSEDKESPKKRSAFRSEPHLRVRLVPMFDDNYGILQFHVYCVYDAHDQQFRLLDH